MERIRAFSKITKQPEYILVLVLIILLKLFVSAEVCGSSILSLRIMDGSNAEILQYCSEEKLIITTNSSQEQIDFYEVGSFSPFDIQKLETSLKTGAEPTSVALSPNFPVVFAAVKDGISPKDVEGQMLVIDIRKEMLGEILSKQMVGVCPDSLATSPDGNWVIVANEAEENSKIAGSITVFDLREVNEIQDLKKPLKQYELNGLDKLLGLPAGEIEPEFVCFAPDSSFAAVSCQENSAIVFVDLRENEPFLAGSVQLPMGSNPDGIALLGGQKTPDGLDEFILAIAEEGDKDYISKQVGQSVSFYMIETSNLKTGSKLLSRIKASKLLGSSAFKRYDPEGVVLFVNNKQIYAAVSIERADSVVILDITDPYNPQKKEIFAVGKRPEGIITAIDNSSRYILTANEHKTAPQLSVISLKKLFGAK